MSVSVGRNRELFLAQAICYVATAPKSNAAYLGFAAALSAAEQTSISRRHWTF